jgi:3-hydroxyacyl-CoA dehydrogenase
VGRIPGLAADTPVRDIRRSAVIGLGPMGRGIVMANAAAGVPVTAVAKDQAHLLEAQKAIEKIWSASVAKGSLSQSALDERKAMIRWSTVPDDVASADLVIEAATEDIAIKREIFATLGRLTRDGVILASNTSYLNIDALAVASGRPADVCGMHFFNPAHVMRLLENVRGRDTSAAVIATIMAFGKRIAKLPVLSGVCDGFIVNRMLGKRSRESYFLLEEGATPQAIDQVVTDFGFPMGPYALADLAGIDVQYAARQARRDRLSPREVRADFVDQMYARGRYGQKSGAGWYRYDDNRKAARDPETDAIIEAHVRQHGLSRREIGEEEIRERLLFAMINEGARLLDEGVVPRPHEIDVAMVNGIGFPAYRGGPMFWADHFGLDRVLAGIERFRAVHGDEYWTPAPLLVRLVQQASGFYA